MRCAAWKSGVLTLVLFFCLFFVSFIEKSVASYDFNLNALPCINTLYV